MTTHEILKRARKLIVDPECWTTGEMGYEFGKDTGCYCAAGAVARVCEVDEPYTPEDGSEYDAAVGALARAIGREFDPLDHDGPIDAIVTFNDSRRDHHADVLAAFDKAIESSAP